MFGDRAQAHCGVVTRRSMPGSSRLVSIHAHVAPCMQAFDTLSKTAAQLEEERVSVLLHLCSMTELLCLVLL